MFLIFELANRQLIQKHIPLCVLADQLLKIARLTSVLVTDLVLLVETACKCGSYIGHWL